MQYLPALARAQTCQYLKSEASETPQTYHSFQFNISKK